MYVIVEKQSRQCGKSYNNSIMREATADRRGDEQNVVMNRVIGASNTNENNTLRTRKTVETASELFYCL